MTLDLSTIEEKYAEAEEYLMHYRLLEGVRSWFGEKRAEFSISASVKNTVTGEYQEELVRDVTSDRVCAEKIFSAVVAGLVTPMTLHDTISDLLD